MFELFSQRPTSILFILFVIVTSNNHPSKIARYGSRRAADLERENMKQEDENRKLVRSTY